MRAWLNRYERPQGTVGLETRALEVKPFSDRLHSRKTQLDRPEKLALYGTRDDVTVSITDGGKRQILEVKRDGTRRGSAAISLRNGNVEVDGIDIPPDEPRGLTLSSLSAGAMELAERRGIRRVRFNVSESPHAEAKQVEQSVWELDGEDYDQYEQGVREARLLIGERVADRFPQLGDKDDVSRKIELLPSRLFEERVDELATRAAEKGKPWPTIHIEQLKGKGTNGFCSIEDGRAIVRWDGAPGELSTAFHEGFHLPLSIANQGDRGFAMPAALREGYAEIMGRRNAGYMDRLGPREVVGTDGHLRTAIYQSEDRWKATLDNAEDGLVKIAGRGFEARNAGREWALVKVKDSYPAGVEAVSRILGVVNQRDFEKALVGDASGVKIEVDDYFGQGTFSELVRVLGENPNKWYQDSRLNAVRELLSVKRYRGR